jgi:hypothetical protein
MAINEAEYLAANPDVAYGISQGWFPSAAAHYAAVGASEGRQTAPTPAPAPAAAAPAYTPDPAPSFDSAAYLSANPDVQTGINNGWFTSAADHYNTVGQNENRLLAPTPGTDSGGFDSAAYLQANPDVDYGISQGWVSSALDHYNQYGEAENRALGTTPEGFNAENYLLANPDIQTGIDQGWFRDAAQHYDLAGRREGRGWEYNPIKALPLETQGLTQVQMIDNNGNPTNGVISANGNGITTAPTLREMRPMQWDTVGPESYLSRMQAQGVSTYGSDGQGEADFGLSRRYTVNPLFDYGVESTDENPGGIRTLNMRSGGEVRGPGTGKSDSIPARLSDGEFVMTNDAVAGAGNGSRRDGAKRLYKMMKNFEARSRR